MLIARFVFVVVCVQKREREREGEGEGGREREREKERRRGGEKSTLREHLNRISSAISRDIRSKCKNDCPGSVEACAALSCWTCARAHPAPA